MESKKNMEGTEEKDTKKDMEKDTEETGLDLTCTGRHSHLAERLRR